MVAHAVKAAVAAEMVGRVVIDSDDDNILVVGQEYGAEPLKRPAKLATNATTGDDLAYWQARNAGWAKVIVQVVPTCPFTRQEAIDKAIHRVNRGALAVAGVFIDWLYRWDEYLCGDIFGRRYPAADDISLPNSKDLKATVWETTGLYAMQTDWVLQERKRVNPDGVGAVLVSRIEAIDINTQEDLDFARIVWAGMQAVKGQPC